MWIMFEEWSVEEDCMRICMFKHDRYKARRGDCSFCREEFGRKSSCWSQMERKKQFKELKIWLWLYAIFFFSVADMVDYTTYHCSILLPSSSCFLSVTQFKCLHCDTLRKICKNLILKKNKTPFKTKKYIIFVTLTGSYQGYY